MKKLILVRHAKSSWEFHVSDHERPLSERGINDAHLISNELLHIIHPELICSSTALRAKKTAEIITSNLKMSPHKIVLNNELYDFSGSDLVNFIKNCHDSVNELMVFGHNNAITNFANKFGDKFIENVPTCGVVIFEFSISKWIELKKGKTLKTIFPKEIKKV
ncbi:SixA phosphatase family protein [Yeosuana sp. AK3]